MSYTLLLVEAAVFLFLAVKCIAIYIGMRKQKSVAWLAAALSCVVVNLAAAYFFALSSVEFVATLTLVPLTFICLRQTTRLMVGVRRWNPRDVAAPVMLTVLAVTMALAGMSAGEVMIVSAVASALSLFDVLELLSRYRRRDAVSSGLFAGVASLLGITLLQVPAIIASVGLDSSFAAMRLSDAAYHANLAYGVAGVVTVTLYIMRIVGDEIASFRRRSERDGLTGLLNNQSFRAIAERHADKPGCVVFCDIDNFKSINDRFGHATGDDVIRTFARLLTTVDSDAARLGGEEFALIVRHFTLDAAAEIAEGVRLAFEKTPFASHGGGFSATASFGVASFAAGQQPAEVLAAADAALYAAKNGGRNRVNFGIVGAAVPDGQDASAIRAVA